MLHGWKEDSMLVKCLAVYTHLSSTVSQYFNPYVYKFAILAHFLHILASPVYVPGTIAVNVTWIEREYNACQTPRSMYPGAFLGSEEIRGNCPWDLVPKARASRRRAGWGLWRGYPLPGGEGVWEGQKIFVILHFKWCIFMQFGIA